MLSLGKQSSKDGIHGWQTESVPGGRSTSCGYSCEGIRRVPLPNTPAYERESGAALRRDNSRQRALAARIKHLLRVTRARTNLLHQPEV